MAYAYFTYRGNKILTEDAKSGCRPSGSLQSWVRGSNWPCGTWKFGGNILGSEQHGFIASVGFELYCRLLEESVKQLKGEVVQELPSRYWT